MKLGGLLGGNIEAVVMLWSIDTSSFDRCYKAYKKAPLHNPFILLYVFFSKNSNGAPMLEARIFSIYSNNPTVEK